MKECELFFGTVVNCLFTKGTNAGMSYYTSCTLKRKSQVQASKINFEISTYLALAKILTAMFFYFLNFSAT